MTTYTNFVRCFAKRTRQNLSIVEGENRTESEFYEVTQLINSLLGMLIFINEKESLPNTRLHEIPDFPNFVQRETRKERLHELIAALRDAISHGQIEQIPNKNGETITGFRFWKTSAKCPPPRPITWEAELDLNQIRSIALFLTAMVEN